MRGALRSAAITVGVLAAAEILLRVSGYTPRWSPLYNTFRETHLYLPAINEAGMPVYRTNPVYRQEFQDAEFPKEKGNTCRIFAIGGSAAHGWRLPDPAGQNFLARLVASLRKAHPGIRLEGINAAGCGWGSFREELLCHELLLYRPDMLIVMTGNNEYWEYPLYRDFTSTGFNSFKLGELAEKSRMFLAAFDLAAGLRKLAQLRPRIGGRYEVMDDAERAAMLRLFESNLRSIIRQCRAAKVTVVFGTTPVNLKVDPDLKADWMAGASRHSPGLSRGQLAEWNAAWSEGRDLEAKGDPKSALARLRRAESIDPSYARLYREIGLCLAATGDYAGAREALWKHIDLSRRTVTGEINAVTGRVCAELGVPLVDCAGHLERASPGGLTDYGLFVDSMHPNGRGHELLAQAFLGTVDRIISKYQSHLSEKYRANQ